MQSICFYEYLPMLGISLSPYEGYDPMVDATVDNFFAAVSYRYGHSEVTDILFRVDEEGNEIPDGHLLLSQTYFNPKAALNNGIEPLLRGLSMKIQAEVDTYFASSIRNYLFGTPMHGGTDLIAVDIQRGRDHGIPDYNTARKVPLYPFTLLMVITFRSLDWQKCSPLRRLLQMFILEGF